MWKSMGRNIRMCRLRFRSKMRKRLWLLSNAGFVGCRVRGADGPATIGGVPSQNPHFSRKKAREKWGTPILKGSIEIVANPGSLRSGYFFGSPSFSNDAIVCFLKLDASFSRGGGRP